MTSVFATIANQGIRAEPSIVKAIVEADGTVVRYPRCGTLPSGARGHGTSSHGHDGSCYGGRGTAPQARIPGYRVAGKTGTAQFVDLDCGCYAGDVTASFIGVVPADAPRLAVGVFVHQPQRGRTGGELAAPVFKEVASYALQAMQIPPSGKRAPTLSLTTG